MIPIGALVVSASSILKTERRFTIMLLNFFGRGSGFSDEHTSAYFFTRYEDMVIIDCPVSTFQKLRYMDTDNYKKFYILITHTHGDHVGGLGLFIQYAFFVLKKSVSIIAPSDEVANDIIKFLEIQGVNYAEGYELVSVKELKKIDWYKKSILTEHSPELRGKCFGYNLEIDGKNVIYTGDTCTLEPFTPYLNEGSVLYVDTSVYYGRIHLKLEDVLEDFIALTKKDIKVYLMHLDDVLSAEKIIGDISGIEIVSIN